MVQHSSIDHTGITGAGAPQALDTTDSPQFAGVNLGHASDTTLTRVSAGVVAIEGTNIVKAGAATGSGLTMATSRLLGRTTASSGAIEEISVGSGLTLSGGTLDTSGSGSGTTELLGYKTYATGGAVQATSGTLVDADATNLAVTFTAPASTNVLVRLTGTMRTNAAGGNRVYWGLRESTTVIGGGNSAGVHVGLATGGTILNSCSVVFVLTGISAGSHTYKWAIGCDANGGGLFLDASNPATMEVWALP